MSRKALNITVELDVHAVTCPGVWLCPNGRVSLRICTLKSTAKTGKLPPVFPLLFHDKFVFSKTFSRVRYLSDLQKHLKKEFLYAELIQWPEVDLGIVLANFETTLLELLFPSSIERATLTGVDVDLLMDPSPNFPGILSPRIEVSTKTSIEERVKSAESLCKKLSCATTSINPKVLSSYRVTRYKHRGYLNRQQRKVCHSKHYLRKCPKLRGRSCRRPFVVRHVDEDIFNYHSFHKKRRKKSRSPCRASSVQNLVWESASGRLYTPRYVNQLKCDQLSDENITECCDENEKDYSDEDENECCERIKRVCESKSHVSGVCPVCDRYKKYFALANVNIQYPCKCSSDCSPDYLFKPVAKNVRRRVHHAVDTSRCYPFLQEKELLPPRKNVCCWRTKICDAEKDPCFRGNESSYREQFYLNLGKFYRRLYKRAKSRAALECRECRAATCS
ncbi:spermatogenesis associated 6-like protein [Anabrus simplex]|uniref:spermatogenesis associated 6-like protein n=1 Tax=Anabrus simplex TaxID=316456 RepID=UPI0035A3B125